MGEMKSGGAKEEEISEGRRGSAEVLEGHLSALRWPTCSMKVQVAFPSFWVGSL